MMRAAAVIRKRVAGEYPCARARRNIGIRPGDAQVPTTENLNYRDPVSGRIDSRLPQIDVAGLKSIDDVLAAITAEDDINVKAVAYGDAIRLIDETGQSTSNLGHEAPEQSPALEP